MVIVLTWLTEDFSALAIPFEPIKSLNIMFVARKKYDRKLSISVNIH